MAKDIFPIKDLGEKGGHGHVVPSRWNPLKEDSVVITDHNTGKKSSVQIETIDLPEGKIPLIKKNGIISDFGGGSGGERK
jgi:hypothetical protein